MDFEARHVHGGSAGDEATAASRFLAALDDPIAVLAVAHGRIDFALPSLPAAPLDHLGRLTLSIIGQVISTRAAAEIFGRLCEQLGGTVTAEGLARAGPADLRTVGITAAKAQALHELGLKLVSGSFSFDELIRMTDTEAEARLVAMRGIGPWSAQMFLLRSLRRPDVFPAGDLGLRRGIEALDSRSDMPSVSEAAGRALPWQPYRSYAAKYLWLHYTASRDAGTAVRVDLRTQLG